MNGSRPFSVGLGKTKYEKETSRDIGACRGLLGDDVDYVVRTEVARDSEEGLFAVVELLSAQNRLAQGNDSSVVAITRHLPARERSGGLAHILFAVVPFPKREELHELASIVL